MMRLRVRHPAVGLVFLALSAAPIFHGSVTWAEEATPAQKRTWTARALPAYDASESVLGFFLAEKIIPVRVERKDNETFLWARLRGELKRPSWNLLFEKNWLVRAGGPPEFDFEVPLTDQTTSITINAFDSHGRYAEQKVDLEFGSWGEFKAQIAEEKRIKRETEERRIAELARREREEKLRIEQEEAQAKSSSERVSRMKRFIFTPMVGYSLLSYDETFEAPVDMMALTPELSVQALILPPWLSVQLSGFITAFSLTNTRPDVSVRFAGADLTVGAALPIGRTGLRFSLLVGAYFKTMFVSPATLGYRNMLGPEVFPIVDFTLPAGHSIHAFAKLSPTLGEAGFLPFTEREIVVGGGYTHQLPNGHQIPIQIEYAWIDLHLSSKYLAGRTLQFSAGYSF